MASTFQKTSLYKDCGFDAAKYQKLLLKCLDDTQPYFLVVGEVDNHIKGALCGAVSEYYFSTNRIASDLGIYVNPEDRRFALKFLNKALEEFELWAKKWKATEICIGTTTGIAGKNFEAYLLRKSYKNVGFTVKKGI